MHAVALKNGKSRAVDPAEMMLLLVFFVGWIGDEWSRVVSSDRHHRIAPHDCSNLPILAQRACHMQVREPVRGARRPDTALALQSSLRPL
jgi:hypothetical protein